MRQSKQLDLCEIQIVANESISGTWFLH
jgi:hypothetical protein